MFDFLCEKTRTNITNVFTSLFWDTFSSIVFWPNWTVVIHPSYNRPCLSIVLGNSTLSLFWDEKSEQLAIACKMEMTETVSQSQFSLTTYADKLIISVWSVTMLIGNCVYSGAKMDASVSKRRAQLFVSSSGTTQSTSSSSSSNSHTSGCASNLTSTSDLASLFECPVCFDYVLPPILQCQAGHLVCSSCRPMLTCCPTCRGPLGE